MNAIRTFTVCFLSLAICFSCISSFCLASAEDTEELTSLQAGGGASISVETIVIPKPNFTVSVPTGIPLGDLSRTEESSVKSQSFTVQVSDFSNMDGKQVEVTLSTPDGRCQLHCGDHVLPYEVFSEAERGEGDPIEMNGLFHTFLTVGEKTGRVEIDQFDIPAEGAYGGILNFHFHVTEQPTS